ncbi:hypothetical protein BOY45_004311, partial [Shigella flexneri]|nr:hypothetical protein [Shigella flexneri]
LFQLCCHNFYPFIYGFNLFEDEYGPTLPYVYEDESDFSNLFDSMPPDEETPAVKEREKPKTVEKQEEFNLFG